MEGSDGLWGLVVTVFVIWIALWSYAYVSNKAASTSTPTQ